MAERRSSRGEGRANETNKRGGNTSTGKRLVKTIYSPQPPSSPFTGHGKPNPPTSAATVLRQGQSTSAAPCASFACSQVKTFPKNPWTRLVDGRPQQFVPRPRPSPFASHPQEVELKKGESASRPTSQNPASAVAKRMFPVGVFHGCRPMPRAGGPPFVGAGDRQMELDRSGAWVGNETDQVFERPRAEPLDRRLIGLLWKMAPPFSPVVLEGAAEPHGPWRSLCG